MMLTLSENYDILMKKVCKKDLASSFNDIPITGISLYFYNDIHVMR